ncbi:hypothetical protein OAT18_02805 [Tenacibaculum sp.]|nr:hypothetical protein [Tenacibaculum sp.]
MIKNITNLGKPLNKKEQLKINGGKFSTHDQCHDEYYTCDSGSRIWVGPCHWPHIAPC